MTSLIQSYGGVATPSFLIIEKVQFQPLPPIQNKQLEVPLKSGTYFVNQKYGVRTFNVSFSIKAPDSQSVMLYADQLATWLACDEPQPLIFRDKPNQIYYAIVDSNIDITKFGLSGKGTITFICTNPHSDGAEKNYVFNPPTTDPIQISNDGNHKVAPTISLEFTKDVTDFAILSDKNMLYFGEPFDISTNTAVDLNPEVTAGGYTTSGWTEGTEIENATITTGLLTTNGYTISGYTANAYGTGSSLHGGSLVYSLGKQMQDFTMDAYVGFMSNNANQLGRLEMYLVDIYGNKMGKIGLADMSDVRDWVMCQARVGSVADGTWTINEYGSIANQFSNFNGILRLSRKGNVWTTYVAQINQTTNQHYNIIERTWTDTQNLFSNPLGAVQLFIGAYGSYSPVANMYFSFLRVTEHLEGTVNQVNYVFKNGDKLLIDNSKGKIFKNGEPYYENLYPSSSWIKLDKGENGISVTDPTAITNGQITFKERWL